MGRYLVIGSLLAALLQTLVPQQVLAALGHGPVLSVVVMAAIAVLLLRVLDGGCFYCAGLYRPIPHRRAAYPSWSTDQWWTLKAP